MEHDGPGAGVNGEGYLAQGHLAVRYETSQPSTHHWVAVGMVLGRADHRSYGLIVGLGRSESGAIDDLAKHLAERSETVHLTELAVTPAR